MASLQYRFLRRKALSYMPTSALGRLTLYLGVIRAVILLLEVGAHLNGSTAFSGSLAGWASTFNFFFGVLLALVVVRWLRKRLLWSVRNRLIVTYTFIGVIPVVLILTMAVIAGYMFINQYAASEARSDIEAEIRGLDLLNNSLAADVAERSERDPNAAAAAVARIERRLARRYPGIDIAAWRDSTRIFGSEAYPAIPAWVQGSFQGIVSENGRYYIRSVSTVERDGHAASVISSMPFDDALLNRTFTAIGQVKFYPFINRALHPHGIEINRSPRDQQSVAGEDSGPAPENPDYEIAGKPLATGGKVPAHTASFPWDPEVNFGVMSPHREWETGKASNMLMQVTTRPSALVRRLFAFSGQYGSIIITVLIVIAIVFGIIELIALFFGVGLTRTITSSVYNLYNATEHINRGDLRHRIQVRNQDQLAALQTAFNSMAANLEQLIQEQKEKQRLESELAIAQEVQATLFPREQLEMSSLEVHGICRPARTVSGDYYDFLPAGNGQLGIAVGDISGKGISAALLMATIHSAVRAYEFGRIPSREHQVPVGAAAIVGGHVSGSSFPATALTESPANMMELLNRHLYHSTPSEKYATLFFGIYDGSTRRLTYTNAGHLPPIIISQDGSVRQLEISGLVIGLFDGITYSDSHADLRAGDIFVAYSDGVTEPENEFGEFGEHRLIEIVRSNRHLPLARISELVTTAVQDWIGAKEQPDDVTVVLARAR
jgi:phosphoserine phosphatase RsbU/P